MFIIFGTPRSGTTLLTQILNCHPDVVIPFETDFIVPIALVFSRKHIPQSGRDLINKFIIDSPFFDHSIGEYISQEQMTEIINTVEYHPEKILTALYARIAEAAGARIAGEKSPNDIDFAKVLCETGLFGENIKIIHLVRDIRDVMVSLMKTGWLQDADGYFPRFWANSNLYLNYKFQAKPSQYTLLRYEDLVLNPPELLARICEFLGVAYRENMLDPEQRDSRYTGNIYQEKVLKPITAKRIGVYKNEVPVDIEALYIKQAREAMEKFGYK